MSLFDRYVIVDWSARSAAKSGADSIWVADLHGDGPPTLTNPRTRRSAERLLCGLLCDSPGRVLLGADFSFSLPRGVERAGLDRAGLWQFLADHLIDDERNHNNRWEVAAAMNRMLGSHHFWGVPPRHAGEWLTTRKPTTTELPTLRRCEESIRSTTGRAPMSTWQLLGNGSVGSQALTGIPVLHRLRHHPHLRRRVRVWPFETGSDVVAGRTDGIVFAEVWPSALTHDHLRWPVKDARQVAALAEHLRALDLAGGLVSRFHVGPGCVDEGWILR